MAGDSIVGALRVVLGMDTASYEDSAKKAAQATQSFGKQVLAIAAGIGLEKIVEKGTKAFIEFGKQALETADQLYKMSQRTGIPVEQLSGLKHAAELSEISLEGLARGVKNMQVELTKAGTAAITPATSALQYLGLSLKEIQKATPQEAILKIAEAVSKLEDGTNKTSVVAAIFGKKFGPELIPFLNEGREGIERTIETARKLGLVIDKETGKNAEKFNDRMKELGKVTEGIALQALGPLSEGLAALSKRMVDFVTSNNIVTRASEGLVRAIIFIVDNLKVLDTLLGLFLAKLVITGLLNFIGGLILFARTITTAGIAVALYNAVSLITVARFAALAAIIALATGSLPTFTEALEKVGESLAKIMPKEVTETVTKGFAAIGVQVGSLTDDFDKLSGRIKENTGLMQAMNAVWVDIPDPKKLFDPEASKRLAEFNNEIRKLTLNTREASGEFIGKLAPGFLQAAQSLKIIKEDGSNLNAVLTLTDEKAKQLNKTLFAFEGAKIAEDINKIKLQARELSGEFVGTLAPGLLQTALSLKLIKADGDNFNATLALSKKEVADINNALLVLDGARLTQEFQTPWQTYEEQLKRINGLLAAGKIDQDTFAAAGIKAGASMVAAYGQAASTIVGGFADAFKIISEKNKKWAGTAKALAIATALVNTFVAATKALADTPGPLPLKIAASVAVTAAGLAQVAKISSTEFQTGGSFKVGGAGGIDSQLVQFKATPGEMVDVRRPGTTGSSSEITIRGMSSRELYSGEYLRDLVEGLNAAHSDGYRLKFAE